MITVCHISGIYRSELGDDIFDNLAALYPAGLTYPTFPDGHKGQQAVILEAKLPITHSVTQKILRLAEEKDLRPLNYFEPYDPQKKYFSLRIFREYDVNDYAQAQYLVPQPEVGFDSGRLADGTVTLALITGSEDDPDCDPETGEVIRPEDFYQEPVAAAINDLIVTGSVKKRMEQAGLRRLLFRECIIEGQRPPKANMPETYWQLTSDLILPPASPIYLVLDDYVKPWDGDPAKPYFFKEGSTFPAAFYERFEWHYPEGVLESVGPFDLALTHEQIGGFQLRSQIASHRFYQFCSDENLKMQWQPVRLDASGSP